MSQQRRFSATIEAAGGGGAFVTVPFDVEREYGRKRVPILAHIDGEPYRGTLVRMRSEQHLLLIRKDVRRRIGKEVGDQVDVTLEEDTSPRVVAIPPDLEAALAQHPEAAGCFHSLSYTHQREYVEWITKARREETRQDRVARTVALLQEGKRER